LDFLKFLVKNLGFYNPFRQPWISCDPTACSLRR